MQGMGINGVRSRKNVYLLKIEAKCFGGGNQDICKDTVSNSDLTGRLLVFWKNGR